MRLANRKVSCLGLHASPEVGTINYKRNEVYEGILFPSERLYLCEFTASACSKIRNLWVISTTLISCVSKVKTSCFGTNTKQTLQEAAYAQS